MLQRSDTAATTGEVRIGKVVEVTVLRRSFVRTGTSTTPVWMGFVGFRFLDAPRGVSTGGGVCEGRWEYGSVVRAVQQRKCAVRCALFII